MTQSRIAAQVQRNERIFMYERILVPVDGSSTAKKGLDEAIKIALKFGSKIRVVHVVDDASVAMAVGSFATNVGEILTSLAESGEQFLEDAKRVAQASGVAVEVAIRHCTAGRASDLIVQEAVSWPCDLIVIGTHGRRGAGRLLLGSDAEQVLRAAPVPVLLVRDAAAR
jgi:nucleotide-binding universal stress UspA family protein